MLIDDRELQALLHTSVEDARMSARYCQTDTLCAARDKARDQGKTSLQQVLQTELNKRVRAGR